MTESKISLSPWCTDVNHGCTVQSMDDNQPFDAWLRAQLGDRSNGQVAEYAGVSASTVHYWRTGKTRPELRSIRKLAAYLKVDPDEIERRLDDAPPEPSKLAREVAREVVRLLREE